MQATVFCRANLFFSRRIFEAVDSPLHANLLPLGVVWVWQCSVAVSPSVNSSCIIYGQTAVLLGVKSPYHSMSYRSMIRCFTPLLHQEYFSQLQDTTDALPCHTYLPVCLWIMDPHSRAPKKNTSHGNKVRPCYLRGSPCQDPADNRTTLKLPDDLKETPTAVVWSCFPFIRSGQNHLARHSERGKKTRQTEKEVGRQHQGMDRLGVRQVPEGSGEPGKIEETGCKIICGTTTTLAVKGLMMMMMMMISVVE